MPKKINMFRKLKKKKEIHIRSIFLQGFLLNYDKSSNTFKSIRDKLEVMDNIIKKKKY